MPPRIAVAGIVAFWLATTGFIAYRDLWPRLFSSGPPPVAIDLADEARQNIPAKWTLYRNGEKIGKLTTQMKYLDAEDAFQFTYRYSQLRLEQGPVTLVVPDAVSEVRVTRGGDLKGQTITGKVEVEAQGAKVAEGTIDVRATVGNGLLTGRCEIKSTLANLAGDLDPVPVPKGQPLNPLQPVNRVGGVRGGQRWVVHESNPLQDAVGGLFRKKLAEVGLRLPEEKAKDSLIAEVSRSPQNLDWKRESVPCWVIEYRRDADVIARTWVRVSDGKVLRQEAFEKGETLMFERED
jgi:hypothetical protein